MYTKGEIYAAWLAYLARCREQGIEPCTLKEFVAEYV